MSSNKELSIKNPRPRVWIDGKERAEMCEAVQALQVHLPRFGMASAELRLENWGSKPGSDRDFLFQDLRHGCRLELYLGEDAAAPSFKGEVTGIEERYGHGSFQLVLLAEDNLHRLARQRKSRTFEKMTLDDVVGQIAGEAKLQSDVSLPGGSGTWLQVNESDLAFLMRQLAHYDIALRLQDGKLVAGEEGPDPKPLELAWERKLVSARIIADLNRLPRKLEVTGYNLHDDQDASGSANSLTPSPSGQTGSALLERLGWQAEMRAPQPFPRSGQEAKALASHHFSQRAGSFLQGEVVCADAAELQGGREVELKNISPRLCGRYRVTECWHRFDEINGLSTRIRVKRPDWSG